LSQKKDNKSSESLTALKKITKASIKEKAIESKKNKKKNAKLMNNRSLKSRKMTSIIKNEGIREKQIMNRNGIEMQIKNRKIQNEGKKLPTNLTDGR
jgi:hypothetical protein